MSRTPLGLSDVAHRWLTELKPTARQLWSDLVAAQHQLDPTWGAIRTQLMMGRLSTASWNQYATALRSFCKFCATCEQPITLDQVLPKHLVDYVCYLAQLPTRLKHATVASYISGIKSVLHECGLDIPPSTMLTAVMAGYKRWMREAEPRGVKRHAWLSASSVAAMKMVEGWMELGHDANTAQHKLIVSVMMVVMASVTFSRGGSTVRTEMRNVTDGGDSMVVKFEKEKRPQDTAREQVHHRSTRTNDPINFLMKGKEYLARRGYTPRSLMFAVSPSAKRALSLDAALKQVARTINAPPPTDKPWTGHCVRIGAVSEAFAIAVPLAKIAFFAGHKSATTTETYVRHDVRPSHAAQLFFGKLVPGAMGTGISPL